MEDIYAFCKKEAIIRDYFMTKFANIKKKNLNLVRMCKLDRSEMTE